MFYVAWFMLYSISGWSEKASDMILGSRDVFLGRHSVEFPDVSQAQNISILFGQHIVTKGFVYIRNFMTYSPDLKKNKIKSNFLNKSLRTQNLDVSSCHNEDFGMRNLIFRSKLSHFGV